MKDNRGQTIIDYSFGVGIFLIVVLFVFITIPSLFAPFESQQEDLQTVERVETALTTNWLLDNDQPEPYVLDKACTVYLFENSQAGGGMTPPRDCRFGDASGDDVTFEDIVPVESSAAGDITRIQITMEQRPYDGTPETINTDSGSVTAVYEPDGAPPSDRNTITVSYRQVYMDGEQYRLYVRVW